MNGQHDDQRAQNGHDSGKKLGKAHEQTVREGVNVGNDPAHQVPLGMLVQVAQRQHLDVPKGLVADVPGDLEGDPVVDLPHTPLDDARGQSADRNAHKVALHQRKVNFSRLHNAVNGPADENRNIQGHDHRHCRANERQHNGEGMGLQSAKDLF